MEPVYEQQQKEPEKEPEKKSGKEPEKKPVRYIENPLPGPKPHVKKQMGYDYEIPQDKMHFDIENPSRNYYDV